MIALTPILVAIGGGAWRWWDGRGFGPGALRSGVCFAAAAWICRDLGWMPWQTGWLPWAGGYAGVVALLFAAIWAPRQRQREELDDMFLRWWLPFFLLGIGLSFTTWSLMPGLIFCVAGFAVAVLVWVGVQGRFWTWMPSWWPSLLDPAALTETAAGAIAFLALDLAVQS